jgi:hypothetical protein
MEPPAPAPKRSAPGAAPASGNDGGFAVPQRIPEQDFASARTRKRSMPEMQLMAQQRREEAARGRGPRLSGLGFQIRPPGDASKDDENAATGDGAGGDSTTDDAGGEPPLKRQRRAGVDASALLAMASEAASKAQAATQGSMPPPRRTSLADARPGLRARTSALNAPAAPLSVEDAIMNRFAAEPGSRCHFCGAGMITGQGCSRSCSARRHSMPNPGSLPMPRRDSSTLSDYLSKFKSDGVVIPAQQTGVSDGRSMEAAAEAARRHEQRQRDSAQTATETVETQPPASAEDDSSS